MIIKFLDNKMMNEAKQVPRNITYVKECDSKNH